MIQELLSKYKDQKPKPFGENHVEKSYPVSAVIAMLEEQRNANLEAVRELKEHYDRGFYPVITKWTDLKGNTINIYVDPMEAAYSYNSLVEHLIKAKELVNKL